MSGYPNKRNDDETNSHEILLHSKSYSSLLSTYVNSIKVNNGLKICLKILFFLITMGSMVAIVYFFYLSLLYAFNSFYSIKNLNKISIEAILSVVTVLLPAISSLIVAFVKIPQIIAEYLFNTQEDKYMNSVIKNIQDYDKVLFAMEQKLEIALLENKTSTDDEEIMDFPDDDVS